MPLFCVGWVLENKILSSSVAGLMREMNEVSGTSSGGEGKALWVFGTYSSKHAGLQKVPPELETRLSSQELFLLSREVWFPPPPPHPCQEAPGDLTPSSGCTNTIHIIF